MRANRTAACAAAAGQGMGARSAVESGSRVRTAASATKGATARTATVRRSMPPAPPAPTVPGLAAAAGGMLDPEGEPREVAHAGADAHHDDGELDQADERG